MPAVPALPTPVAIPPTEELLAAAVVVRVPLRVRFRGVDHREAVLLRGPWGWGEFAPFREYDDAESARWLLAAVEAGWHGHPAPLRREVEVNATVPAVPPERVAGVLARFDGCTTAKVKVAEPGQRIADDLARVGEVRRLLGPAGRVRVDANGAWSVAQAREALARLARHELEYAEQPCRTVPELAQLRTALARDGVDVPVAADESVRRAEDPLQVARAGAADLVVVKVPPLGGVRAALEVVAGTGLPAVVSSALDTSVGLAAGVALAAALPGPARASGLGTAALLAEDVVVPPLLPAGGRLTVAAARAAAVDPGPDPGPRRVTGEAERWWLARLARCAEVARALTRR